MSCMALETDGTLPAALDSCHAAQAIATALAQNGMRSTCSSEPATKAAVIHRRAREELRGRSGMGRVQAEQRERTQALMPVLRAAVERQLHAGQRKGIVLAAILRIDDPQRELLKA